MLSLPSAPGCSLTCYVSLTVSDGMVHHTASTSLNISDTQPPDFRA
ncbi:MAG: hypothetical protein HY717_23180 [Planctomycetes bacterium]|nr:hypothetical protein [Planctomycetota bacterium]